MTGLKNIIKGIVTAFNNLNISKLPNALQSINTDKIVIDVGQDDVGLAKDATINSKLNTVSNSGSVAATANSAGLTVSLEKEGKPFINVFYDVGSAAEIYVEVSVDNSTWRPLDKITTTAAKSDLLQYPWVTYPYVRVRTPTTGIAVEFEIIASR